jgi:superfamily II DNA/RNA helicase
MSFPAPQLQVGDAVVVRGTGEHGVVIRTEGEGTAQVSLPSGVRLVALMDIAPAAPEPDKQLLMGSFGTPEAYGLRLQSLYLQHSYRFDPLSGLSNARVEPQFHQVFVAWRVNHKLAPRMILADEVGLGKTIEAGLILKELRARGLANRVLVVCPSSLQLQWQQELRTKFNESFEIIDGPALKHLSRSGNPWERYDSVICSLPFASHRSRIDAIVETEWDLVIFDEAHRVRRWLMGKTTKTTQAYRLADELKELVPGLLLLTATPMQLHPFELYSLIELAEPGLFPGFGVYEAQRAELPALNGLVRSLLSWDTLSEEDITQLCKEHRELLADGNPAQDLAVQLSDPPTRETIINHLAQRHPLADVLVRNRKSEVGGFVGREATSILVDIADEELQLYEDVTDYCRFQYDQAMAQKNRAVGFVMVTYQKMLASSGYAIKSSLEKRVGKLRQHRAALAEKRGRGEGNPDEDIVDAEELSDVLTGFEAAALPEILIDEEIETLQGLIARLAEMRDSKAYKLLDALNNLFLAHPDEKVLIFTTFKETQAFLRQLLQVNGHKVSVFHGSLSIDQKEDAIRTFREQNRVLISTEAGGEGRNLQFCHIVVNYDLPWNPMKVEQRIGRIDRIGQKRTVQIWNLACARTVEERVLRVLQKRIGLFEESVGSLDPILGDIAEDIQTLVMTKLDHLADEGVTMELDIGRKVREAREKEHKLADFALDRASLRRDVVSRLLEEQPLATHGDLRTYADAVLRHAGGALNDHAEGGQVVTVSPQLGQRMKIRGSTVRGCFSPEDALRFEELQFFAFGNDLISELLALPEHDPVTTTMRFDGTAPPGASIEVWYEIEASDVQPAGKFIRHLVGEDLRVASSTVRLLPALGGRLSETPELPAWSVRAIEASRRMYQEEFKEMRSIAHTELIDRKAEARKRAERVFDYRRERLNALIADESGWIERAERGTSERDKKILPARRGKLERRRQDLEQLEVAFDREIHRIEALEPNIVGRMLAAGIVVGDE